MFQWDNDKQAMQKVNFWLKDFRAPYSPRW